MTTGTTTSQTTQSRWLALAGLWLVYFSFGTIVTSLAPLLSEIREDIGADNASMGAVLGAWALVYVLAAIPCGMFLDKFGLKIGLFTATILIALSAALRAIADTPIEMLLAVAVFGIGGPLISVGAPKLITDMFPSAERGTAMGLYVTGPSVGVIFTLSLTNEVFLPMMGDWRGVMLLHAAAAVGSGIIWLGLASLARFPRVRVTQAPFDRRAFGAMMRDRQILLVLAIGMGVFYLNHSLSNWLPEILRDRGMDAAIAGRWASIPTIVSIIATVIIPRFATSERRLKLMVILIGAGFLSSFFLFLEPGIGLLSGLILQGVMRGTLTTIAILVLVELPAIPNERLGLAAGVFFSVSQIGGLLGPLCFGLLVAATGNFEAPLASLILVCIILFGLVGLLSRSARIAPLKSC